MGILGTDIKKINLHKKITNCNIIFDDINKNNVKADIINVGGVLNRYDNPGYFWII